MVKSVVPVGSLVSGMFWIEMTNVAVEGAVP